MGRRRISPQKHEVHREKNQKQITAKDAKERKDNNSQNLAFLGGKI